MIHPLCRLATACFLAAALCVSGVAVGAVEPGAGTKNFSPPGGVPNYFSNEAEPFMGQSAAPGPILHSTVSRGSRGRAMVSRGRFAHGRRVVHGRGGRLLASRGGRAVHASGRAVHTASGRTLHTAGRVIHTASGRVAVHAARGRSALPHHASIARRRG